MGVLRHAHAPEDDRAFGTGVGTRDVTQGLHIDAADRRHLLGREVLDVFLPGVKTLDVSLDVLLIVELLGDNDIQHGVEHRHVRAVLELHHLPGMALHRRAARIHDDEFGAALGSLLEECRGNRMVVGRVGADDDDDVGVLALVEGRGHGRRADAFQQRRHRRGVAEPRAMVDVVGAEAGAHQLLEQIGLFVRALGRAEAGQRIGTIAIADFLQATGGAIERLLPCGFAEMCPWVRRIDKLVRYLRHTFLADHRLQKALRIGDIVEAEAAFHAKTVRICRAVLTHDRNDLVVLDLVGELTANAAIGAHTVDLAVRLAIVDVAFVHHGRWHQRAGRTGLHAFAARNARRVAHRIVEIEHDFLKIAASGHADHIIDLHFAASADAQIALNARIEIDRHGNVAAVGAGTSMGRVGKRPASIF